MAGKRRKAGKPLQRVSSAERRQAKAAAALTSAIDPGDRVWAAANHVKSAMARHPGIGALFVEDVIEYLVRTGDRIYAEGRGAA
jgi:hypothetical protein